MSAKPLNLPLGVTEYDVKVHPVVLFTICDAFIRRNEDQDRVIGTLLGTVADGTIDIRSCYAVPHSESNDQVRITTTGKKKPIPLSHRTHPPAHSPTVSLLFPSK
jgi:translation initiation factor 3 subunit F